MLDRARALEEIVALVGPGEGAVLVAPDAGAPELARDVAARLGSRARVVAELDGSERAAAVVLAGALEASLDPAALLARARDRLAPGGVVVGLAPNVAHGARRLALLAGRSPFETDASGRARGAWDRAGLARLLGTAGLVASEWRPLVSPDFDPPPAPGEPELRASAFPPAIVRALRQDPDALAAAWVVAARPGPGGAPVARAPSRALEELRAVGSHELLDPREILEVQAVRRSLSFQLATSVRDLSKRVFPLGSLRGRAFWGVVDRTKRALAGSGSPSTAKARAIAPLGPTPEELARDLAAFLASDERLVFPAASEPRVSVLLVTYGKAELTLRCLRELRAHGGVPLEVVLVDNASPDATPRLLDRLEGVRVLRNTTNEHFLAGTNRAARDARAPSLFLLNSDAFVTEGALPALVAALEREPAAGAVGAKLVWPDGRLQEAGSLLFSDGSAHGYGRGEDPGRAEFGFRREVDGASAAALLVRRASWERLGGFDARFAPAYYEDADLCLALRESGEKVLYEPEAVVVHAESGSSSRAAAAELCRRNQAVFRAKWQAVLERRPPPGPGSVLLARDRRPGERVLVIDDRLPRPQQGAGYPRMFALVRALAASGRVVTVVPLFDGAASPEERLALGRLGIEALHGPQDLDRLLRERRGLVRKVLVSRPHTAEVAIPLVRKRLPEALVLYDAEALFHERERERVAVRGSRPSDPDPELLRRRELALVRSADKVLVVSERDAELVRRETSRPVLAWPHAVTPRPPRTGFRDRRDLLFVGSFTAPESPNEDAVVHFATEVLPRVRAALPGVRLVVAGTDPTDAVLALQGDAVQVLGRVPDLEPLYERARVFVAPLRFGAGISLKLVEALAAGVPAVASPVAGRGMPPGGSRGFGEAADDESFARAVVELHEEERVWERRQREGLAYVKEHFDPAKLGRDLDVFF